MSIADLYDASFGGQSFLELFPDGFGSPAPEGGTIFSFLHYPGSDDNDFIIDGADAEKMSLEIAADKAHMDTIKAKEGTPGTLVYSQGSRTAWLVKLHDRKRDFLNVADKAVLDFVVT